MTLKRRVADVLRVLGSPFELALWSSLGAVTSASPHLLWAVPLTLITLPLAPFYLVAEERHREFEREDFAAATAHLPRMSDVPDDHLYLSQHEDGTWLTAFGEHGPYPTEEDLREALKAVGYHEVIDESNKDHHLWGTCWVR